MKAEKIFLPILIFSMVLFAYPQASKAALNAYMTIEGEISGKIPGDVTQKGREDTHLLYSFGHNIAVPFDPQGGTGKPLHKPLQVLKRFNRGSPSLYQALLRGEHIKELVIKFYRIDPTGKEEHYFTMTLEDGPIVKIAPSVPNVLVPENEKFVEMEIVSFTYRRMTWEDVASGNTYTYDWLEPNQ